ncbi:hypothetical protein [Sphingobacterium sp.]|uniref:hypothetical protein n=1 Tax=Sphingobacterium sp. TaxID=341027 RepID=UPI0031D3B510
MKKIFNKIGQVLQLLLAAPVKLPGKVGNVLRYVAIALGVLETVLEEEQEKPPAETGKRVNKQADLLQERSEANEAE